VPACVLAIIHCHTTGLLPTLLSCFIDCHCILYAPVRSPLLKPSDRYRKLGSWATWTPATHFDYRHPFRLSLPLWTATTYLNNCHSLFRSYCSPFNYSSLFSFIGNAVLLLTQVPSYSSTVYGLGHVTPCHPFRLSPITPTPSPHYHANPGTQTGPLGHAYPCHPFRLSPISTVTHFDCHPFRLSPISTVTHFDCHPFRLSPISTVTYFDCHPFRLPPISTTTHFDYHPFRLSPISTVTHFDCHPFRLSPISTAIHFDCHPFRLSPITPTLSPHYHANPGTQTGHLGHAHPCHPFRLSPISTVTHFDCHPFRLLPINSPPSPCLLPLTTTWASGPR
jgi:hypothetical protein